MSRTRTHNLWLVAILPDHYTTKADYVIPPKSFLFNAFSTENPPANTIQDDRAASNGAIDSLKKNNKTV